MHHLQTTLVALLLAITVAGCTFGEAVPENPTPDLQATIETALHRISAEQPTSRIDHPTPGAMIVLPSVVPTELMSLPTATLAPTPTSTPNPIPTYSAASIPTATPIPAPTPTSTPVPTPTYTPVPTATATPIPTSTPAPTAVPLDGKALEKEVHQLINAERVNHGLPRLEWNEQITAIARAHSEDMAQRDYFSHDNPEGENPTDRAIAADYPCRKSLGGGTFSYGLAENIWRGWEFSSYTYGPSGTHYVWMSQTQLAKQAVSSWMGSSGHRKNILTEQYDRTGIGVGFGTAGGKQYAVYLTQNFC